MLILVDLASGRRHRVKGEGELVEVEGLGVISSSRLEEGRILRLAGRRYLVRRPLPEDVPAVLRRAAQFNSPTVNQYMIMRAGVRAGSFVVEAGAGSGGLTVMLLSAIGESGRLVSYERREDFAEVLRRNVESLGLGSNWVLKVEDFANATERGADALLVDLPEPWEYAGVIADVLRPGGRVCAHCMSALQAWRTHLSLAEGPFAEVGTYEVLERSWVVDEMRMRPEFEMLGHHGFVVCGTRILP